MKQQKRLHCEDTFGMPIWGIRPTAFAFMQAKPCSQEILGWMEVQELL